MSTLEAQTKWGSIVLQLLIAVCLSSVIWTCHTGQQKVREDKIHNAKASALINQLATKTNVISKVEDWKQLSSALIYYGINGTKAQAYDTMTYEKYLEAITILALSAVAGILITFCLSFVSLTHSKTLPKERSPSAADTASPGVRVPYP